MTLATMPLTAVPAAPVPGEPAAVSAVPVAVSETPAAASPARWDRSRIVPLLLMLVAVVGGTVVGGIGFAGSYNALRALADAKGFGGFAPWFPVGLDAGIVVLLALDLYLARRGAPWPLLRLLAHTLTAGTIWFNANSGARPPAKDPVAALMHVVMPVLFVAAVEAARKVIIRAARLEAGRSEGVPLHRWLLAPSRTWAMYRRMRLWGITSYARAVGLERERTVYRAMLDRKYGAWKDAPADARLPFTMARYGLSVEEALALPQQADEAEQLRLEREETRRLEAETRAVERAAAAEVDRLRAQGRVEAARHVVAAETGVAEVQARAARTEAELAAEVQVRAATADQDAIESAAAAEARARAAAAERAAAEDRRRAAETNQAAAETERAALETATAAAELQARKSAAERTAADDRERAADIRRRAAEIERAALEAEDAATLKPTERAARKVARMILATGTTDPEAVDLQTVATALGVGVSTASERRRQAAELLAGGYRPEVR